jgi:membrane-associated phospholipid phosphatase
VFQAIHNIDLSIYHFLSGFAGNWVLDRLASQEESNNLLKGGIFFAIYWYLWFRSDSDRESRRSSIVAITFAAPLAIMVARTIAFLAPFRMRPIYEPLLVHPLYSVPVTGNLENWSSFPSDTAAYFFALAFGLAYLLRRFAIPIMLYTAGWICLPRLYLGFHYASDIVVGSLVGISLAWISLRSEIVRSMVARRVLAATETRPEWIYPIAFLISFEMATVFEGSRLMGRALLNAARVELHLGVVHTGNSRPIDEWGVLLAMAALLVTAVYGMSVWSRKIPLRANGVNKSVVIRKTVDWRREFGGSSSGRGTLMPPQAHSVRENLLSPTKSSSLVDGKSRNL